MAATLSFQLKNAPAELFDSIRWPILTLFIVHANIRNRVWLSQRTLATRLGKSVPYVNEALRWLREHGAITLVPRDKLVEEELKVPGRQHVYQLTGVLRFGKKTVNYLYVHRPKTKAVDDQPGESSMINRSEHRKAVNDQPGERSTGVNLIGIESESESSLENGPEKQNTPMRVDSDPHDSPEMDFELKLMLLAVLKVTGKDYRYVPDALQLAQTFRADGICAEDVSKAFEECRLSDWRWTDPKRGNPRRLMSLQDLRDYIGAVPFGDRRYSVKMDLPSVLRRVRQTGDFAAVDPDNALELEDGERLALAG